MIIDTKRNSVPWFLWPIILPLKLVFFIISLCGRFLGLILAVLLIILGKFLTATIIGAIIGIPMLLIGILLAFGCLFKW